MPAESISTREVKRTVSKAGAIPPQGHHQPGSGHASSNLSESNHLVTASVVMPAYNEESTIAEVVELVLEQSMVRELIIVDDASTDGTAEVIRQLVSKHESRIRGLFHEKNRGKGAALRTAISAATSDTIIIQDADLEYDPTEYTRLLQPIVDGKADAVFGSRFLGGGGRVLYFWHSIGNQLITLVSNMFTNLNLTDIETCYKVFRRELIQRIPLEEERFGIEPEMTAKIAQARARIFEVPISYNGRTYEEGKKIGWKDGVRAMYCIVKYNVFKRSSATPAGQ